MRTKFSLASRTASAALASFQIHAAAPAIHAGMPLCNAIVWLDTRTSQLCQEMQANLGSKVSRKPCTQSTDRHEWSHTIAYHRCVWKHRSSLVALKSDHRDLCVQDYFRGVTGLPISTYFSAFKFK